MISIRHSTVAVPLLSLPLCKIQYLKTSIPVEQLKDCHELLELEHGLALVGLQHVAEGRDAGAPILDAFPIS